MPQGSDAGSRSPVGIICGGGALPFAVADSAISRGIQVVLFAVEGAVDPQRASGYAHEWISLGQFGRLCRLARERGCHDLVWIGKVVRPKTLAQLKFDLRMLLMAPRLIAAFRGGDDHLLRSIGAIFEENGFRLIGAQDIAPEILVPEGDLTVRAPNERNWREIAGGRRVLAAISDFDMGQAVVMSGDRVLALEGPEGTDAMLARVAELRARGRIAKDGGGVLVKAAKSGQDRRFDLPTIGPATIDAVAAAGLEGIAVSAGDAIVADSAIMIAQADRAGLFVTGYGAGR